MKRQFKKTFILGILFIVFKLSPAYGQSNEEIALPDSINTELAVNYDASTMQQILESKEYCTALKPSYLVFFNEQKYTVADLPKLDLENKIKSVSILSDEDAMKSVENKQDVLFIVKKE